MRNFDNRPQRILLPAKAGFIALSVVAALGLNLMPWGDFPGVPDFVALVLVFWCIHQPRRMGMGIPFAIGLIMDAALMSPPRRLSVPIDNRWGGGRMSVLDFGDPKRPVDLIFSHANGFPGSCYRRMHAELQAHYPVAFKDRLGHDPRYPVTDGWPHLVAELVDYIESLGKAPV